MMTYARHVFYLAFVTSKDLENPSCTLPSLLALGMSPSIVSAREVQAIVMPVGA